MKKNYYEVLGITPNASDNDIKNAYKTLCKKYHPDISSDKDKKSNEDKMKEINVAYGILGDKEKRVQYDNPQPQFNPHDMNDILRQFMGGHMPGGFQFHFGGGHQHFTQIFQQDVEIDIFTLILGGTIDVVVPSGNKKISIPPNTSPNTKIRIKEGSNMEIHINIIPIIPSMTDEQIKGIKKLFPR